MNILLLGSGGREHALAWKLKQSPKTGRLFVAPGNAGTADVAENLPFGATDFEAIKKACLENDIQMVVVGPEEPLVKGIYDFFRQDSALQHIPLIGPSREGARLEGSKDFAKAFMQRHGIPTAAYRSFTAAEEAEAADYLGTLQAPYVLKADGLAAGKGVLILDKLEEARRELGAILDEGRFGEAGNKVVIESFLKGIECSVFLLTDGEHYLTLPVAKDYKRLGEGGTGPNTGGMGAVSPVPFADKAFLQKVDERISRPTVEGLRAEGIDYKGFIFLGLMNVDGDPYVIEYNCRMGDPETQVVMPRICNDLVVLLEAVTSGTLDRHTLIKDPHAAVTVVLASGGYPGTYAKGLPITGIPEAVPGDFIAFHAATTGKPGDLRTNGGRVLSVSANGSDFHEARNRAYEVAAGIHFENIYYRKDIGLDL
ncbi:MAG: phosphoribosylamine--glycine ligase [Tannerella sp.]|jgi:phosphoribosylamine--glycine ligase|nr:phosphoribosylamine--glycine ligase [Tannerella sp.]